MLRRKNTILTSLTIIAAFAASSFASSATGMLKKHSAGLEIAVPEVSQAQELNEYPSGSRSAGTRNAESEFAHQEWLNAKKKYADGVYQPKNTKRMDVDGSKFIMFQGFHWYADSYWLNVPNGWWGVVAQKASELGRAGFNLIWLPPVSNGSYYPNQYYNLTSQWGNKENLKKAVNALHGAGLYVLGDAVLNHRNGTTNWADFTNPDWPTNVIFQSDEWPGDPSQPNRGKSQRYDEGDNDSGCRDIDHSHKVVQDEVKIFLRWLRSEIGFDGWRYDMVKGYSPYWVGHYNYATQPMFSIGEYFDGNKQALANWIDGTDGKSGKPDASTAFDFPTHFALKWAVQNDNFAGLNDNGRPSGLIGWWPAKAVTFIENHDTSPRDPNFIASASTEYKIQMMMSYAYLLTHPGTPCVFWPHYFDWGDGYKNQINKMVQIRKNAGISSTSRIGIMEATGGLYAAVIDGDRQRVVVKLGKNWGWQPGGNWTLAASGERYAIWTQNR